MQHVFFFTLLTAATFAFFGLLNAFIIPIFWAITFAIVFEPLNDRFSVLLKGRGGLASALTLLGIVLLIVLPLLLLALAVTNEVAWLIGAIERGEVDVAAPVQWFRSTLPTLFEYAGNLGFDPESLRGNIANFAVVTGRWLAANALQIGQNTVQFLIGLTLMLYLLFFFLRDGHALVERLIEILPLGDVRERHLFARFAEVVRATVKGTFVIAAVQGAIGGIAFAALGLEGAVLWGALMAVSSLLPVVGPALVWLPAAIMLLTTGDVVKGIVLIVVGALVIAAADNLLRPVLVGRDIRMPDYLVLLATLGGLAVFGITGLVIGPLIAALFITLWEMFEETFGDREAET
ncbi:MAG: AI-2E family transporter [Pseudomonadota bacterium]